MAYSASWISAIACTSGYQMNVRPHHSLASTGVAVQANIETITFAPFQHGCSPVISSTKQHVDKTITVPGGYEQDMSWRDWEFISHHTVQISRFDYSFLVPGHNALINGVQQTEFSVTGRQATLPDSAVPECWPIVQFGLVSAEFLQKHQIDSAGPVYI